MGEDACPPSPMAAMYHVLVFPLQTSVLAYIRKHALLKAGDRVGAAVSGGADSVALLRLLLDLREELGIVLSVVHFNHQLRGAESDEDEHFVAALATQHKLPLHRERGQVSAYASEKHLSVETAAREMRYSFFRRLLLAGSLDRIATGHTLDDQAETVLLRMVRGAGTRGLAGIYPKLAVSTPPSAFSGPATIIRPLLSTRRKDLEEYLKRLVQDWREDSSNRDLRHARNRVRHGILPRMAKNLNPAVREVLAETAEVARAEEEYWRSELAKILVAGAKGVLPLAALRSAPQAVQRRLVRAVAESVGLRLEFRHVEEVLALTGSKGSAKSAELPAEWFARRTKQELRFERAEAELKTADYQYRLPVPGSVDVPEAGARFEALLVTPTSREEYNREDLLDSARLGDELWVRNWRAGDRFQPAHSKGPKKIKELLQERQVTGQEKKLWPVLTNGTEIVWVRGFAASASLRPKGQIESVLIRETLQRKIKPKA